MFLVVWKHAQMHQNTFLTTPDTKKYLFQGHVSGGLKACANASKHVFDHYRRKIFFFSGGSNRIKNTFLSTPGAKKHLFKAMFLVIWNHAKMHQNTF
jgi:hypothetical protein